jgi:putative FmdB family regulatory protein
MPIYEYECLKCGIRFDLLQRFDDPQPETCPRGHTEVHRLLSHPAIIFKGSGFYVTDHGRNGRGTSAEKRRESRSSESVSTDKNEQEAPSTDS